MNFRTVPATDRPIRMREHVAEDRQREADLRVDHVADAADRLPEEVAVGDAVQPLGEGEEVAIAVAGSTAGGERSSVAAMSSTFCDEVERRAVGEEAAPLRVEADQVEVVLQVAARPRRRCGAGPTAW